MEQITSLRSFAGIFPPVLRSLWSPITPLITSGNLLADLTALTVTFIIKQALNAYFSYGENRGGVAGKALPPLKKIYSYVKETPKSMLRHRCV